MPRTKRPVRKQDSKTVDDDDAFDKKLKKLAHDLKYKVDTHMAMEIRNLNLAFKIVLGSIPADDLQKTIGQLKSEILLNEAATPFSRSRSNDDGYNTENSSQGSGERTRKKPGIPVPTRSVSRRSRSADASCRRAPHSVTQSVTRAPATRRRSRSVYRTPAYNRNAPTNYPAITPKVAPQTPLTVLRQPRQGEMVVSMAGSPVLVPSCYTMQPDAMANCNILLDDGTMLSLQPQQLRDTEAYIPFSLMGNGVLKQLKTLKDNLDHVVKLGEKALK